MKSTLLTLSALLLPLAASCASYKAAPDPEPAQEGPNLEGLSEEEMMAAFMELATPGPEHEMLATLVGTWHSKSSMWMDPAQPPEESEGTLTNEMILGGRFLQGHYEGTAAGYPFTGLSLMGYDKTAKRFHGTWLDTFTTAMLPLSSGEVTEQGVLTLYRRARDGMTGEMTNTKDVMTIVSDDEHHFEMYRETPDGWVLMMRLVYTRQ